jgi:hypothetical protein
MNSTGNLLSEIDRWDISHFSKCRVYSNGKFGWGTSWEYESGGNPFEVEITPEQAQVFFRLQERFSRSPSDEYEEAMLRTLPNELVNRYEDRIEISSNAQVALYDLIE